MIIRALQLAFIILAIAVIYPFYGREPVLFPKDTATPDGIVRTQKSDRLAQPQKSDDETIVIASLPPAEHKTPGRSSVLQFSFGRGQPTGTGPGLSRLLCLLKSPAGSETGRYDFDDAKGRSSRYTDRGNQARFRRLGHRFHFHEGSCKDRIRF